ISHVASVSDTAAGASTTVPPPGPSVSQDGRYVVFVSNATNLVTGQADTNNSSDVFLYDRVLGTNRLVSGAFVGGGSSATNTGNGASYGAVISSDGQFVVFSSNSTNLVASQVDGNG